MDNYCTLAFKIPGPKALLCSFFMFSVFGFSQDSNLQNDSKYLFSEINLNEHAKDLSEIYALMGKYYEGVERAKLNLLEEVFHSGWFMRDTDTPGEATLNVESKQKFIKRVGDHGPYPGYAVNRKFATVGFANDNIAFVRINKKSATSFFLYKIDGKWSILDKLWTPVEQSNSLNNNTVAYAELDNLVNSYYKAISKSDEVALSSLLHESWNQKTITTENRVDTIYKSTFLKNLASSTGISKGTKLHSMDLYHGKLAIIRIDYTEESTTTFFVCFKMNGEWTIACERTTVGG